MKLMVFAFLAGRPKSLDLLATVVARHFSPLFSCLIVQPLDCADFVQKSTGDVFWALAMLIASGIWMGG